MTMCMIRVKPWLWSTLLYMRAEFEKLKQQMTSNLTYLRHDNNISHEELIETLADLSNLSDRLYDEMEDNVNHVTTQLMRLDENLQQNFTNQVLHSYGYFPDGIHTCGGTRGWRRVVYLDMTDPNTSCPSGWQLTGHPKRTCGRVSTGRLICDSVIFPVSGGAYTSVCGTIRAYQYGGTDGFTDLVHALVGGLVVP